MVEKYKWILLEGAHVGTDVGISVGENVGSVVGAHKKKSNDITQIWIRGLRDTMK